MYLVACFDNNVKPTGLCFGFQRTVKQPIWILFRIGCFSFVPPHLVVSKCAFPDSFLVICCLRQRDIFAGAKVILLCMQSSDILFVPKTRAANTTRRKPNITAKQ